jgi:hypothetical protein
MSELIRIDELKANAEAAAIARRSVDESPYKNDPRRDEIWRTYYFRKWEEVFLAGMAA